jgi:putative transcription antitermination factor YqgF
MTNVTARNGTKKNNPLRCPITLLKCMKNYLGLDWGKAKIGVALGHAETRLALTYIVLPNDESFIDALGELISQEEIGTIVIGIHKSDRYEGEHEAEAFGQAIAKRFQVTVEYHDEMFTTKMAQSVLIAQGEKHISAHDDAESARIILQSWFDIKR